jgi:hypothetical protein
MEANMNYIIKLGNDKTVIINGVNFRNAIEKAVKDKANLTGANLTGANLTWANLSGANLNEANLSRANLSGANLNEANLSGANLTGANLTWANLNGANLSGALESMPIIQLLTNVNWDNLPNNLILELMRHDAESCGIDAMTAWANGGECPFNATGLVRDYIFRESQQLWIPGSPTLRGMELLKALCAAEKIIIS